MKRSVRYQAAILNDNHLLLLKVRDRQSGRTFWLIPGGGRIAGESEEACVRREVREETNLDVSVGELLFDEPVPGDEMYQRVKTYLCRVKGGEAKPGQEPEVDTADYSTIVDIGWFDLRNPASWDSLAREDPLTYPLLRRLSSALVYK